MLRLKAFSSIGNKMLILLSGLSKNEKKEYAISDSYASVKYSHTLIQQTLLYMALADSNGVVPFVHESELALEMDCSVRTVQLNNKALMDAGVLECERLYTGCAQIRFRGYLENVLDLTPESDIAEDDDSDIVSGDKVGLPTKFESNKGYTVLSAERVRELVHLKDVNALRIALRFYRAFEKDVASRNQSHAYLSYKEFKQFLPKYLHFPKAINELLGKIRNLFQLDIYDTVDKIDKHSKAVIPTISLAKKLKGRFLARLTLTEEKTPRYEKSKQVIGLRAAFNELRNYTFNESDYHSRVSSLSDEEIKALVSSFGLSLIKDSLDVIRNLYSGTPVSLEETDKPPLMQRFEFNPSLCLREIATNF